MADGEKKTCMNCSCWQRDGADGICRAEGPKPAILESGKNYSIIWPRTNANDCCLNNYKPVL